MLLHGRDEAKGEETLAEIRGGNRQSAPRFLRADLASLRMSAALAELVLGETARLDVLVNNAGIGTEHRRGRERGEPRWLRAALRRELPGGLSADAPAARAARRSAPARIVNVSSAGQAPIDFDDVMLERSYSGVQAYCHSKLAQIMFTFDLARSCCDAGVTANCLHPATFMPTNMVRAAGVRPPARSSRASRDASPDRRPGARRRQRPLLQRRARGEPDPQAATRRARGRLRELSDGLCGLEAL